VAQVADEKRMTIFEHLAELRMRLIRSFVALGVATLFSLLFTRPVFEILKAPAQSIDLIFIDPTEGVGSYFRVALLAGVILAMPAIVYQAVMFVVPGLTPTEKRYLFWLLPGATLSFVVGVVFAYAVLMPPALTFLLGWPGEDIARPQIRLSSYIDFVTRFLFWVGVVFETPLIIYFLAKVRVVSPQRLASLRKYAIVGAFALGAVITPTFDPVNQTLVAVPLILLYEVGILLARLAYR